MRIFWAVLRHVFKNSARNTIAGVFPEAIEIRDFSVKGYKKTKTLHLWLESLTGYHSSRYFFFSTFSQPINISSSSPTESVDWTILSNGRVRWRTSTSWSRIWRKSSSSWCLQPIRLLLVDDEVWVPLMCCLCNWIFVYFIITTVPDFTSLLISFLSPFVCFVTGSSLSAVNSIKGLFCVNELFS